MRAAISRRSGARARRRLRLAAGLLLAGAATLTVLSGPGQAAAALPPIKHIWIVVMENEGIASTFDDSSSYLGSLVHRGALVDKYYATAHQSLPNYVALIGGQGPTPQTQGDCQVYQDVTPGTVASGNGHQAQGDGCVYPTAYRTVADQITAAGLNWKGYMEDLGLDSGRDAPVTCKSPTNSPVNDSTQTAEAQDQYAARHDPFMYYHTIVDSPACKTHVVTLQSASSGLLHDLASIDTTPNYSFISPNLCDDGHDTGCKGPDVAGDSSGGLVAVNHWLEAYVPPILSSPAYKQDGMLVITFDEVDPKQADATTAASCCSEPFAADGQPAGGYGGGGGIVGALVLSPFVAPNTKTENPYNHYSLLRTVEDVLHLGGGDDQPAPAGHLGLAADYFAGYKMTPFGDDVFTNPGYVPPVQPAGTTFAIPTLGPILPTAHHGGGSPGGGSSPPPRGAAGPSQAGATPTPSDTTRGDPPASPAFSPRFLASPGGGSGAGTYILVLAPLLAVGVAASLLVRRRSGGTS